MSPMGTSRSPRRSWAAYVAFLGIPFAVGLAYLLAFYPGIMSYDSIDQWAQLDQFRFTNWHPAYHTILMWLITRVWYSPAAVAVFQIMFFAAVCAYTLNILYRDFEVPLPLLLGLELVVCLLPINGLMIITLWKDVSYSIYVLLATAFLLRGITSRGEWFGRGRNWVWFGLVLANIALLRHNGLPVAIGIGLAALACQGARGFIWKANGIGIAYIALILLVVYRIFAVDTSADYPWASVLLNPIAAHVVGGTPLTSTEATVLERVYPLDGGWPYSCYDSTVLIYSDIDLRVLNENPWLVAGTLLQLTARAPVTTIAHFACLSSFVLEPAQPPGVYLETVLLSNYNVNEHPAWIGYRELVNSRLPVGRRTGLRQALSGIGQTA